MRLSDWRDSAPRKDSMSAKVMPVIDAALEMLGADRDPACWVVWGDDPAVRYTIFVPSRAGLLQVNVRVNVPGEGPRAAGKVIRWVRVQTGEMAIEIQGGHRLVNFQLEGNVIRGQDAEADAVSAFILALYDAIDGRPSDDLAADPPAKSRPAKSAPVPNLPQLPAPKGSDH